MSKEVYWHLPGFCYFRILNQILINLMKSNPQAFREGYRIGSVYGTFPGAIWNGGRAVMGSVSEEEIKRTLEIYNKNDIPVRFTWTNSVLEEEHIHDKYCNRIMELANNGLNQVLVNRPVLEEYLMEKYPDFKYISSTTKRIVDEQGILEELQKDYFMVVLDYDMNHDTEALKNLQPYADRVEILVDEICYPHCPMRTEHYRDESIQQLKCKNPGAGLGKGFPCPNKLQNMRNFSECMKRPSFLSTEDVEKYVEMGYVNFKLVGRGLPEQMVKDSYLYYLVKDEYRDMIREKMDKTLGDIAKMMKGTR